MAGFGHGEKPTRTTKKRKRKKKKKKKKKKENAKLDMKDPHDTEC